jgi:hypothetical protein
MEQVKLRDGDYCPDGLGGFQRAEGWEGVLERVLFLLTVRRGSFPFLPDMGSRLYLLPREKPSARSSLGASYAAEALADEDVTVTGADWDQEMGSLTVYLTWQGEEQSVRITI